MTSDFPPFLTEEEVLFHRMEAFHRQRVEVIENGKSPLGNRKDGLLVAHFVPVACVRSRLRFDSSKLKDAASFISALGSSNRNPRFNVDGLLSLDGHEVYRAYSQVFRDGRLEVVMSDVSYELPQRLAVTSGQRQPEAGRRCLRDSISEKAVIQALGEYLRFCKTLEIPAPIIMFSAILSCEGVRICSDRNYFDTPNVGIDRTPAFLPDIEIPALEIEPQTLLRPWCDTLWQACGMEKSLNFDEGGKWRERR
jgi:hypothetical protein